MDKDIELEMKILNLLALKGTMHTVDIAYELDITVHTVEILLKSMNAMGEVIRIGYDTYQNYYKITEAGLDMIRD